MVGAHGRYGLRPISRALSSRRFPLAADVRLVGFGEVGGSAEECYPSARSTSRSM